MTRLNPLYIDETALWTDLETLGTIGAVSGGGVTRLAFTEPDRTARGWLAERMQQANLQVRIDAAGNIIGTLAGTAPLPPIAIGSHIDTVPQGGKFDGALGVLAAVHAAEAIVRSGCRLRHPVEVIAFAAEEAVYGAGTLGSLAMTGRWDTAFLTLPTADGRPLGELLREADIEPNTVHRATREPGTFTAFLELHIEQGQVLEASGAEIGIVTGIVGISRFHIDIFGRANHAGTTPMGLRDDALAKAARFIVELERAATALPGAVATVGQLAVTPGAPNIVPGRVTLSVDVRSLDEEHLRSLNAFVEHTVARLDGQCKQTTYKSPVPCDATLLHHIEAACVHRRLTTLHLPSGAGHDAMCMAALAPTAMIFVPSIGGISHSPDEWTPPVACKNGAEILLDAVLRINAADGNQIALPDHPEGEEPQHV